MQLVDWEKIHLQLLEYKQEKGVHNLIFDTEILKRILSPNEGLYKLSVMGESEVVPTSLAELERLEGLVLTLLRKYIAKFYSIIQKRWNEERVQLKQLDENDTLTSQIGASTFHEMRQVKLNRALKVSWRVVEYTNLELTTLSEVYNVYNVYNDRHLYQPLLTIDTTDKVWRTAPPFLEASEKHFVEDLHSYVYQNSETVPRIKKDILSYAIRVAARESASIKMKVSIPTSFSGSPKI